MIFFFRTNAQDCSVDFEDRNKAINLTNYALKLINIGEFNQAIDILSKAISTDSTFRGVYQTFYKASILSNNYSQEIINNLKRGNRIFIDDDELSFYLAEIYRMNNEIDSALNLYTYSINLSKVNGEDFELVHLYYLNRGNCFLKKEQYQLAIEDYNYSLKLNPYNANVLSNRGVCFYKIKDNIKACDDWKKSSELGNSYSLQYLKSYCK